MKQLNHLYYEENRTKVIAARLIFALVLSGALFFCIRNEQEETMERSETNDICPYRNLF
ncbi:MAG: hypothetical protein LBK97_00395 [Prevotellaceae bacterium]|nr:hypothetical protein [Prevotellaceae bacterium]